MRIRMIVSTLTAGAALLGAAFADAQTAPDPAPPAYAFDECERPAEPVLAVAPAASDRRAQTRARNEAIGRYNLYIGEVNIYFECLSGEAERDLAAYYAAVSASLAAEEEAMLTRLEALRAGL